MARHGGNPLPDETLESIRRNGVALKGPITTPIGEGFRSVYFCDWTEEGTLLGNSSEDGKNWSLVVFDKQGRVVRRLDTAVPPAEGPVASWRKYGRQ